MAAMFYEDFSEGQQFRTGARTITEADIVNFAGISGDFNPLHMDETFGKTTPFGRRIAHGLLVLSISSGLSQSMGILTGTTIAFLGLEWRFVKPVFINDTVRLNLSVADLRETSKPDRGIIVFDCEVVNQEGAVVQEGKRTLMVRRRG